MINIYLLITREAPFPMMFRKRGFLLLIMLCFKFSLICFEFSKHFRVLILVAEAYDDCEQQTYQESRNNFVQIEDASVEIVPYDDSDSSCDYAGNCTFICAVFPEKREQNERPECSTESGPCIAYETEDRAVFVERHEECNERYGENGETTYNDHLFFRELSSENCCNEVFAESRSGDEKLRVGSAHCGCKNRAEKNTAYECRVHLLDRSNDNSFLSSFRKQCVQIYFCESTDRESADKCDCDPD